MQAGQTVTFDQGDEQHTQLTGTIKRIRCGGQLVTIEAPGAIAGTVRTFIRDADRVQVQA
jgi:hypothetical protein